MVSWGQCVSGLPLECKWHVLNQEMILLIHC